MAGTAFIGSTKDTNFWTETNSGSGAVTQTNGVVVLATGVTLSSSAQYQSVRFGRYIPGQENICRLQVAVSNTGTAGNVRNWGCFNTTDGFFFQLSGTNLNVVSRLASSDTAVAKASWNVSTSFTLDTNYHDYEIGMSDSDVHFYIDGSLVHSLTVTSAQLSGTLSLPVTFSNTNTGITTNLSMSAIAGSIIRVGQLQTETIYKNITGAVTGTVLKVGAGRLQRIVVGNNGTTLILYDNTTNSAPIITTITPDATAAGSSIEFDCPFSTGLVITTTGAGGNYTIIYE